jgi:hypothetical protein
MSTGSGHKLMLASVSIRQQPAAADFVELKDLGSSRGAHSRSLFQVLQHDHRAV